MLKKLLDTAYLKGLPPDWVYSRLTLLGYSLILVDANGQLTGISENKAILEQIEIELNYTIQK